MIIPACKIGNLLWVGESIEGQKEEGGGENEKEIMMFLILVLAVSFQIPSATPMEQKFTI